jgi:methyl-accepting chemotaxis protein
MQTKVISPKSPRSMTTTLAFAFVALSVIVLLIAGGAGIYFHYQAQRETITRQQQLIAYDAASQVVNFVQRKFDKLKSVTQIRELASASPEQQKRALAILLGIAPAIRRLALLDTNQKMLANESRLSQATWKQFRERIKNGLFPAIRQKDDYIGPVIIDDLSNEPHVIMAVPVLDIFHDVQGALVAEVNLKFMWEMVNQLKVGKTGVAYVVDRKGNLIAFGDIDRVLRGENVAHLPIVAGFTDNGNGAGDAWVNMSTGINGTTIAGTLVPLKVPDWAVVTEVPVREAYQAIIFSTIASLGVMLITAVLAGFAGVQVARRVTLPITNLTKIATRITKGETSLHAPVEGPHEIAVLAGAFNNMTRTILDDMAYRRESQETLARYAHIISSTKDLMAFIDHQYVYQAVNDSWTSWYELDREKGNRPGDL